MNTLRSFKSTYEERVIKGIFISLKNTLIQKSPLIEHFIKQLDQTSIFLGYPIALGDYSHKDFEILKAFTAHTQIKLFQDLPTATLLLNPKAIQKELRILLYDEDEQNAQKISSILTTNGHHVIYAHSLEDFQQKATSSHAYHMTIMQNCLNLKESSFIKPTLALSKELIINLPAFIDTAVNSLVTITGLEACKIKHEIKPLTTLSENVIIASMRFKGDIAGNFLLIFPKPLALLALESMIGEPVEENDNEAILDGIGEFCNIITGGVKVIFSTKKLKVLFELPKTYLSLNVAMNNASHANGIWIEMALDRKPFYMFVTA
ncbi:MAG: chemotaxis protein CheX [Sulfurospirillaceae bacterium]|nr:chemotaxis protein CheX [Sulfurospirillaceae bacterium]MDD2827226.1 chemotaxis protein CheX [Sulfurospirillaceae bacterium]